MSAESLSALPPVAGPEPALHERTLAAVSIPPAPAGAYVRYVKPVLDWIGAILLFVLTLPVLITAMIAIGVTMGRPYMFRQSRVGRGGRAFTIYKLRTMREDPEYFARSLEPDERGRINHKREDDPRITKVGQFLRRWNIDELPQLLNVLKGEMSLVGPRPELVEIVEHYEPWQHARHLVKPGLTGLWQVSARHLPMHQATHLDLRYVDSLSFATDVRLTFATIPSTLRRQARQQ